MSVPVRFLPAVVAALAVVCAPQPLHAQKNKGKKQVQEEKKPWWDSPQPRFSKSELGRVFSGTIDLRNAPGVKDKTVYKAIAVRLGEDGDRGTAIFDAEMCRLAAAVPEKPVMFNTYRDGLGGAGHWVGPPYVCTAPNGPAWAGPEGGFDDPRAGGKKSGPLPGEWARYRGHYRHGEFVVFSYEVGGVQVLECPTAAHPGDSVSILDRHLRVGPSAKPMTLRICNPRNDGEMVTSVAVGADGTGLAAKPAAGAWTVTIPPRKDTLSFVVSIASRPAGSDFDPAAHVPPRIDLAKLTRGGPARFPEPYVTKGTLGGGKGAYVVDTLTPPFENPEKILFRFGGHDFFSNGDLAACTVDGDVWRVSGVDEDLDRLEWRRYATGLFQALGLRIVDDKVHVLGRDQITRLHDLNDDGEADFYECFNNQCKIGKHVHEFATGLETDPQGNFYFVKGHGGGNEHAGTLLKVTKDGSDLEVVATGFRWPNGSGVGPRGEMTVAAQQGTWTPSSRIDLVQPGGFYGFLGAHHRETAPTDYDGPLCWIPHGVDNSSGGQAWVTGGKWGPFDGHMVHTSYGKCDLFLVLQENVDGHDQAGVYRFPLKFQSGAMRARFSPRDGQLYVSGLRGWQTSAAKDGCLQRVRHTGRPVFMPKSIHVHRNGIRVGFTQPLDRELAEDPGSWSISQWNYRWTKAYGSKEYSVQDPEKIGHDPLEVASAKLLPDKREVFIEIPGLAPVMQMQIHFDLEDEDGEVLIGDLYNTIHALGAAR